MLPIDPDDALLRALRLARDGGAGDPGSADEQMASRIGAIASGGAPAEPLVEPPAALWDAIARELQLPGATGPVAVSPPAAGPAAEVDAVVVPLAPRRRLMGRRWLLPVVAAAAVAIVVGVFALSGGSQPGVVAEVALQPLEGDGSGEAKVLALDDGAHRVEVSERFSAVPADSYVEVWLIDPDSGLEKMVSLGSIDGDGSFDLPASIDIRRYRVVDISIEPADGVPTHSGRSILRAELPLPPS